MSGIPNDKTVIFDFFKQSDINMIKFHVYFLFSVSSFVYLIIAGSAKVFGILYTGLLDHYDDGAGRTAWISSILYFLYLYVR